VLNDINIQAVVCVNIENDRCLPLPGAKKRYFNIMVALSRQKIHVQIERIEILIWSHFIFGILNSTIGRPNQLILDPSAIRHL
jgi:hypothetical protein